MTDTFSKTKRSEIMSQIGSKDSKMEINFRKAVWRQGLRYSKNSSKYFGKPDLVLKKYSTVVFIDSCFWHGCKMHCRMPSSNKHYWDNKINRNIERDKEVNLHYRELNWDIIRIWEHDISENFDDSVKKLSNLKDS